MSPETAINVDGVAGLPVTGRIDVANGQHTKRSRTTLSRHTRDLRGRLHGHIPGRGMHDRCPTVAVVGAVRAPAVAEACANEVPDAGAIGLPTPRIERDERVTVSRIVRPSASLVRVPGGVKAIWPPATSVR